MQILPRPITYTGQDFALARRRAFDLAQSARPEWADESRANIGNILLELGAHSVDLLAYMINAEGFEAFIASATRRESMIALGALSNYQLDSASAATASVELTLDAPAPADVLINAGTVVRTSDSFEVVRFRLLSAISILAGATAGTAIAEHSEARAKIETALGLPNLDLPLEETPFLDGSTVVSSTGEGAWTEVESLLSSNATDLHYSVLVDSKDRAKLRFGDNVNGKAPTGTITVGYKIGGGIDGNVDAGKLDRLDGSIIDAGGTILSGSITNALKAAGGSSRESLEAARLAIPEWVRAAGARSVSEEDFEIGAKQVPGVARAMMLTSDTDEAVLENTGLLLIVPDGGGIPSEAILDAVITMVTITRPTMPTFTVRAEAAIYIEIDVSIRLYIADNFVPSEVANAVRAALVAWFAIEDEDGAPNESIDWGLRLPSNVIAWSDVFNEVRDLPGVQRIKPGDFKLGGLANDFSLANREFPILGSVSVTDASTNLAI